MNNDQNEKKYQDIPTSFFKPIKEVKEQQEELIANYNKENNINTDNTALLEREIESLKKALKRKRQGMSYLGVLIVVVVVNLVWFLGVKFIIVPKYEKYVKDNQEIKENYDNLKRKVDAIVGE